MQQQEYILFPTGGKNNERQKYHRRIQYEENIWLRKNQYTKTKY